MNHVDFDDEMLMAYADGELAPEERQRVAEAEARDPAIATRIHAFRASRQAIADLFGPVADEPVPAALLKTIGRDANRADEQTNVLPFKQSAMPQRYWSALAMAASVAAVAAGLAMHAFDRKFLAPASEATLAFGAPIEHSLSDTLAELPSGAEKQWLGKRVRAIGTFMTREGTLCRDFEYDLIGSDTYAAVACLGDRAWSLAFAVRAAPADNDYAPASSQSALDSYLAAIEAGPLMTAEEEKAALATLTR